MEMKKELEIDGKKFVFLAQVLPERKTDGSVKKFSPQEQYAKKDETELNAYGDGEFCKFSVKEATEDSGVYLFLVDDEVVYIGETENLKRQMNSHFGTISSSDCYEGGQETNCRINKLLLDAFECNKTVLLYFFKTESRKKIKSDLISKIKPQWNRT